MKPSALRIPFAWEDRHPILLDRCFYLPGFYEAHEQWGKLSFEQLFGNPNPVVIEYCSGNGQWICQKAKEFPHKNWVAVEKRFDRARKIWAHLHRESLPNVFVVCGEAVLFTKFYVPEQSVSEVFVNFPDPWPKLRHAKHRLIRPEFLSEVHKILRGKLTLTTDDPTYRDQMLEALFSSQNLWRPCVEPPHFVIGGSQFGPSYFSTLWISKGKNIYHLPFERTP